MNPADPNPTERRTITTNVDRATAANAADRLIVALDVPDRAGALALVEALRPAVRRFKVGLELFTAEGPALVEELTARGVEIFLDLKFHDIPNTVAGAVRSAARTGAWLVNVHAGGGRAMLARAAEAAAEAARQAGRRRPLVLAVTVLTSLGEAEWRDEVGMVRTPEEQVGFWARLAREAGLDGVVCSPREAALVRRACGPGFLIVTPGVRPAWAAQGDQRRVLTPAEALAAGADYLVVGRPVTGAADPLEAARRVIAEMGSFEVENGQGGADVIQGIDAATGRSILEMLKAAGVYMEGHFLLTSGRHSRTFFMFSQAFQHPRHAEVLGRELARLFAGDRVETVVGPAMGGVILAHEVARALGCRSFFAEKAEGGMAFKRGFAVRPGERVLVVEDVVTTGGSVKKVIGLVQAAEAEVVGVGAILDRSGGMDFGVLPFRALATVDAPSYRPEECPLCRDGQPVSVPKAAQFR